MTIDRVLVIGYGNPLRGDDAVGLHVGDALRDDPRLDRARIITCPQLTPELAEDISAADLVVLVDARVDQRRPGAVRVDTIVPGAEPRPSGSHVVDANDLIELARTRLWCGPPGGGRQRRRGAVRVRRGIVRRGVGSRPCGERRRRRAHRAGAVTMPSPVVSGDRSPARSPTAACRPPRSGGRSPWPARSERTGASGTRARETTAARGVEQFLHPLDLHGATLDHHAPCFTCDGVVAVDFEGHRAAQHGPGQLRPGRRAEHDGS